MNLTKEAIEEKMRERERRIDEESEGVNKQSILRVVTEFPRKHSEEFSENKLF